MAANRSFVLSLSYPPKNAPGQSLGQPIQITKKETDNQMETTFNFNLEFAKNSVLVVFNQAADAPVVKIDPNSSKKYGNALTTIMNRHYQVMEPGLYLHKTLDEIMETSNEDNNCGYVFGSTLSGMLKDGSLTYERADDVQKNTLYRVRWNGFDMFVSEVPYRAFDEDEADYVDHNRNALKSIRTIELLRRNMERGQNIEIRYFDSDIPYFEGENGLKVKYLLWKNGNSEELRKLVNAGVKSKQAFKAAKKFERMEEKAAEGDEVAGSRLVRQLERHAQWKIRDIDDNVLTKADLIGRTIQLHAGTVPLRKQWPVDENNVEAIVARLQKGLKVSFVDDAVEPQPKKSRKGRNAPQPVSA